MGRKKLPLKKIEDERKRVSTRLKRQKGLVKKGIELSVLCQSEVLICVRSIDNQTLVYSSSVSIPDSFQRFLHAISEESVHEAYSNLSYHEICMSVPNSQRTNPDVIEVPPFPLPEGSTREDFEIPQYIRQSFHEQQTSKQKRKHHDDNNDNGEMFENSNDINESINSDSVLPLNNLMNMTNNNNNNTNTLMNMTNITNINVNLTEEPYIGFKRVKQEPVESETVVFPIFDQSLLEDMDAALES